MTVKPQIRWGLVWNQKTRKEGRQNFIICCDCIPKLFVTRQEAREYRDRKYSYVRDRQDLRKEPHGWRLPIPVKLKVEVYDVTQASKS